MVEGADGLAVVEAVQQSPPLGEVSLSQGDRGRDRDVMVAQVGVERDRITGLSVQRHQDHQQMMYVHRFPLTALLTETPQPIDVVLGEPPSPIPLFLPRIAPHVVAVLLPEAGHVLIDQREAPYPLRALPEIQVRSEEHTSELQSQSN